VDRPWADLYVYFFERSLQLLRVGGVLSFITSNKYFRADYGKRLRTYLAYATRPSVMLDFGDAPVFTSIAYPAIIVTRKTRSVELGKLPEKVDAEDWESRVMTWTPGPDIREFPEIFEHDAGILHQRELRQDGWRLGEREVLRLVDKIRGSGTPLGSVVSKRIFAGIKTGLNDAFLIDSECCKRLLADDPCSADIIKPYLHGKHIRKWHPGVSDQYIIYTPHGIDIDQYPAVKNHLRPFKSRLETRALDQKWYELQQPQKAFTSGYEGRKIVYPNIAYGCRFAADTGSYLDMTSFCICGPVAFLLPVLNSSVITFFFAHLGIQRRGGYQEFKTQYVQQFPIPETNPRERGLCERLAEALIWLHSPAGKKAQNAPTGLMIAYLEQWLNGLVYELFFPGELHARRLKLFDETAKLNPPDLANLPDADKLTALQELHEKAYAKQATLRGMLFDLKSLDVVRVIEDADESMNKEV